ncbi:hypothetical protein F0562_022021 [Nyssa sinensis]|uniref:Mitochondrial import inner membrane translocase subunit n=1 Tax=Nyssa sinensis TaxID=561372 RepID=A0A5J5BPZ6_9ASTE|nr:hypothetical protein F0562_022021 [Nyssa sinensis]
MTAMQKSLLNGKSGQSSPVSYNHHFGCECVCIWRPSCLVIMAANTNAPAQVDKEQIFGMAEKEMEYRVELFNKLTHTCFNKCVEKRYKESELNMGENSCIDRCVSKYWQVTNLIGQLLGSNRPPM